MQVLKKSESPPKPQRKKFGSILTIGVFSIIGIVYLFSLLSFFPAMPITTNKAENIASYVELYPPFRLDEYNYYTIAKNFIKGELYKEDSLERSFSIGFPIVASPFIAVWDEMGGYIANMVIMWFSLVIFYLIARRYVSRLKAQLFTILLAFATLNWFYAVSCYAEPLAELLVLLGFYFITWDKNSGRVNIALFCAGFMMGINIFVRPHYILIVAPFFLFTWIEPKKLFSFNHKAWWYVGGVSVIIVLWLVRNKIFFGGLLDFEYSRMIGRFTKDNTQTHYSGNVYWGMHQLLFHEFHGLLTITPILMIFPAGIHNMWQKGFKKESLILLVSVLIFTLFIATSPYPFTEFGLGSRHMVPIIPLIFLPLIFFLDATMFTRIIIVSLATYSFYHAGIGWFTGETEYIGEMGLFTGLLHDRRSEVIIQTRKNILPDKIFNSEKELMDTFWEARKKSDYLRLFQTLHPQVIENINGRERWFVSYIRTHKNPQSIIISADPKAGILFKKFVFK